MAFTVLPAVDVVGGRAVRLVQGETDIEAASSDPLDAALAWQKDGAEWVHLVDIDAAFGQGSNAELLASIIGELDVKVELAGGIHDDGSIERALATGCDRVVIATTAVDDLAWCAGAIAAHRERVVVGLDVRITELADGSTEHRLAARGQGGDSGDLWAILAKLDQLGCLRYVVTDVSKDGMLTGPNIELYRAVTRATAAGVIASGGISEVSDLVALAEAGSAGANIEGAIVGKALYAGRFTLLEALSATQHR